MLQTLSRALSARRQPVMAGEKDKGFTLIELMVVVIIIGILAAIAIPVLLSQRKAAWETAIKSDLAHASVAAEAYAANNSGSYAGITGSTTSGVVTSNLPGLNITPGNVFTVTTQSTTSYTFTESNPNMTAVYTNTTGSISKTTP